MPVYRLQELADHVGGSVQGDADVEIHALGQLHSAGPEEISFLGGPGYRQFLSSTRAAAVVLTEEDAESCRTNCLVTDNPRLAFARLSVLFETAPAAVTGVHASAVVDATATLGVDVAIGPHVVIGAGVRVGDRCRIDANTVIDADCELGPDCWLHPNVTLYHRVRMGARCVVHSSAVLGGDGFGFTPDQKGHFVPVAQVGGVLIGDDVSIGASTTVDRGAIEDTRIGDGVKIDNQVQIGHNCVIGDHSLLCGCVGLSGSSRIGRHCVLAGGVGVGGSGGPIDITDGVTVSGMTHVSKSIDKPGLYSGGVLFSESREWKRNALRFGSLDAMARRLARLEKKFNE